MRYAIYFTPPAGHPLTVAASGWLGRDAFTGEPVAQTGHAGLERAEIAFMTAAPRRYGFHGTIVAPFQLAPGLDASAIEASLDGFCAQYEAFDIPELALGRIGRFFALVPSSPVDALNAMESAAVEHFHPLMAPLSEIDIARRDPDQLTARQRKNLLQWGYPYVREEFRFHMTLTGPVEPEKQERAETAIRNHFGPRIGEALTVGGLALFAENEPGAPFTVRSLHRFRQPIPYQKPALSHV